jgi:hypothetical protein
MREAIERMRAAWYVLRGWAVIRGVSVTYGEVELHGSQGLMLSGQSALRDNHLITPGPVTFRGPGGHEGNEGTALPFSEQNRAGWVRGEGGVITWPGNPPPTLPVTGQTGSHEVRLDG